MATTPVPGPGLNPPPVPPQQRGQILDPKWLDAVRNRLLATLTGLTIGTGNDVGGSSAQNPSGQVVLTLNLNPTGVVAGTYGDSTHVGQFAVDANGRIHGATNVQIVTPPMQSGPTSGRPVGMSNGVWYLDTSLSPVRPVLSYSPSATGWIDAAGNDV
jgi:hypothetical protein